MADRRLKLGVAGLGRAFTLMLPTFSSDPRIELVAAADPRPEARETFQERLRRAIPTIGRGIVRRPDVEAVYVATPHQHHAEQSNRAAARGKHVLVEKPMAITLERMRAP